MTTAAVALEEAARKEPEVAEPSRALTSTPAAASARVIVTTIVVVQAGWLGLLGYVAYKLIG